MSSIITVVTIAVIVGIIIGNTATNFRLEARLKKRIRAINRVNALIDQLCRDARNKGDEHAALRLEEICRLIKLHGVKPWEVGFQDIVAIVQLAVKALRRYLAFHRAMFWGFLRQPGSYTDRLPSYASHLSALKNQILEAERLMWNSVGITTSKGIEDMLIHIGDEV